MVICFFTHPGEIIHWVALDREQHNQHSLIVMVTDQGHPRFNATATVHILVTDINDNTPQFIQLPASKELSVQVNLCFKNAFALLLLFSLDHNGVQGHYSCYMHRAFVLYGFTKDRCGLSRYKGSF